MHVCALVMDIKVFPKHIQLYLLCIVGGDSCGESLVSELRDAVMSCWIFLDGSLRGSQ